MSLHTDWVAFTVTGQTMTILGARRLHFSVQGIPMTAHCLVTDEVDEMILGYDWLVDNKIQWNFGSKVLSLPGTSIPLKSRQSIVNGRRVHWSGVGFQHPVAGFDLTGQLMLAMDLDDCKHVLTELDETVCDSHIVGFTIKQCMLDSGMSPDSSDIFACRARRDVFFFPGGEKALNESVNEMSSVKGMEETGDDDVSHEFSESVSKIELRLTISAKSGGSEFSLSVLGELN